MKKMSCNQVREMLLSCTERIIRNEPYLTYIDSAIGDGDHGIGMKNGMKAARLSLEKNHEETNIYKLYADVSAAMERAMGGASGMIFSTLFAGSSDILTASEELSPSAYTDLMAAGLNKIKALGHAEPGDKTMVDALQPAVEAMQGLDKDADFEELFAAAADAAAQGVENTKKYVAKFGRSKSLGERAIGHEDAGAVSTWLIFQQMYDYVSGNVTPDPELEKLKAEHKDEASDGGSGGKKIINAPENAVREETEGFLAAYGGNIRAVEGVAGLVKKKIPQGKTALLIGGGSGHEPMFGFFIGENLADAAAAGNVFTSPDPVTVEKTAEAADRGAGVLFVYGNYSGDNLNFDKAAELLKKKGIETRTVRVRDDVASAPRERISDRRGIAGDVFVLKIAGAACAELSLDEAWRVTEKANSNTFTIGVGLSGATIPGQKNPIFTLPADEMEYGLGIHGEPGICRCKMASADEIVSNLVDSLLTEGGIAAGDEVCTYVNGLGSTTMMELMIMNRKLAFILREKGIKVHDMDVNSLVTTMEMAGASITIMKLDSELRYYYDKPCRSPYYYKTENELSDCVDR